jgi:hypothetical protein
MRREFFPDNTDQTVAKPRDAAESSSVSKVRTDCGRTKIVGREFSADPARERA